MEQITKSRIRPMVVLLKILQKELIERYDESYCEGLCIINSRLAAKGKITVIEKLEVNSYIRVHRSMKLSKHYLRNYRHPTYSSLFFWPRSSYRDRAAWLRQLIKYAKTN